MKVVRGNPSDEEVAALVVALRPRAAEPARRETSAWSRREDLLRRPVHPGPGAWRASAR